MWAQETIYSSGLLLGIPLAILAGLISFFSPCVLPIVPGYFGYIAGLMNPEDPKSRQKLLRGVIFFILGFTTIFVAMNAAFGQLGFWFIRYQDLIIRISGVFVILMGLIFLGKVAWAQTTVKFTGKLPTGSLGAYLLGLVFAVGWTPCLGPVLVAINTLSLQSGSAWMGVALGICYALGLGIPFLLMALGLGWLGKVVSFVRKNIRVINILGASLLIAIGVLMVSGVWSMFMYWLQAVMPGFSTPI